MLSYGIPNREVRVRLMKIKDLIADAYLQAWVDNMPQVWTTVDIIDKEMKELRAQAMWKRASQVAP